MDKIWVVPARDGVKVPPHPIGGPMPKDGAEWPADQYTFRLERDGDIKRADKPIAEDAPPPPPPPEGSAGISFMITAAQKAALRDAGFTDEQIADLKPADAHAVLAPPPKPVAPAPDAPVDGAAQHDTEESA